ncbi:unnamed protein product [Polarella glacialis]|uniref:Uncharacterized protein n=1 Tax=Polarella glacialis TaxID=89957 RepID=A0A813L7E4_POLGL|nr:unnamed protein product [Polarella glacialis]
MVGTRVQAARVHGNETSTMHSLRTGNWPVQNNLQKHMAKKRRNNNNNNNSKNNNNKTENNNNNNKQPQQQQQQQQQQPQQQQQQNQPEGLHAAGTCGLTVDGVPCKNDCSKFRESKQRTTANTTTATTTKHKTQEGSELRITECASQADSSRNKTTKTQSKPTANPLSGAKHVWPLTRKNPKL